MAGQGGRTVARREPSIISYEFIRQLSKDIDKFEVQSRILGKLHATQSIREIGRLHTYYPGERSEYDYTKYALWLYPNENWPEPILYYTGFGIDHESTVIKGYTCTVDPSARDVVRLVRNCVLPPLLWLPEHLRSQAQHWDVFGIERISAIDNGMELVANSAALMFFMLGAILLRMPPRRGDMKGTVERTQSSAEWQFIRPLPGYVPKEWLGSKKLGGFDPRYKRARERAKAQANLTVADYEKKLLDGVLAYNHAKHPRLRKPRIDVWRDGQELAPLVLPTGDQQIRSIFALTYEVTLTREGVEVETLKFNSHDLHMAYRTYSGKVHVKLNPDDISRVLVFLPRVDDPIEAFWTTFDLRQPITLELLRTILARLEALHGTDESWKEDIGFAVLGELQRLQTGPVTRTPGKTARSDAQAATHAAAAAPALPTPEPPTEGLSLFELLRGRKSDDK